MHNYKKLTVWQDAMKLAEEVYRISASFPVEEKYGLTSQIRRAAVSVPSNIAEGSKRKTKKDFERFLDFSSGSAAEVETQLELAKRLKLTSQSIELAMDMCDGIMRKITKFKDAL